MPSFTNLLIVVAVGFAAPFALGWFPRLLLPSVVLEIVPGIVVGPSLLGVAEVDQTVQVVALVGLGFVLAQIRVRASLVLFVGLAALAETLGLEAILGAFVAGAIVSLVDGDRVMTHPEFRHKLEAVGFGFFIPVFFVTSGVRFNLDALTSSAASALMVVFLLALLVVRGIPAILYRRLVDGRHAAIAGVMQATSLPFIVAATAIGMELGLIDAATGAALVGAGLLSVLLFPLAGLLALRRTALAPSGRLPVGAVTPRPTP